MSAYNEQQIGILVRRRLGLPPDAVLRFIPLIPAGLLRTCRKAAVKPRLRHLVWTDKASVTASLDGSGVCDLSTLLTTNRVQLDLLKYGEIYHSSSSYPLRLLETAGQGQFVGSNDVLFLKCWLIGSKLYTRSSDNNATPLSGSLSFAVPYWQTLAQLPESLVEMEGVGLVDSVIDLLTLAPEEESGSQ